MERSRPVKLFVAQNTGFGGDLSDVTNLTGEKHLRERLLVLAANWHSRGWTPSFEWRSSHAPDRTRRSHEEVVPMIRLRWEARPFAYNRSNPGRSARFRNMLYRIFFPRLHHQMRGNFFRCQRSGCMMWRWETKDPPPSEPSKGYCGLAGTPFAFTAQ